MSAVEPPLVPGVAGGSGAGKSTVVRKVIAVHPDSLETPLLVEHVGALVRGETVEVPETSVCTDERAAPGVPSRPR